MPNRVIRLTREDGASPDERPGGASEQTGATGSAPDSTADIGDAEAGGGRLTAERLSTVLRRLESSYYDTREVREHVARRVQDELQA